MGFAVGNQLAVGNQAAAKAKLFYGTVMRAVTQDDGKRLRRCAETLLTKAANGEPWAVLMLRDTLDGKPMQAVKAEVDVATVAPDDIEQTRLVHLALKLGLARLQAAEAATTVDTTQVDESQAK